MTTLSTDNFTRANQSGFGTSSGGDVWGTPVNGTGTAAIASNLGVFGNNNNDTQLLLGSKTASDVNILAELKTSDVSNLGGVLWRYTSATSGNGYRAGFFGGTTINVDKYTNGTRTNVTSGSFAFSVNTLYWIRVVHTAGGKLYVRVWANGSGEPSTWLINGFSESTFSSGGYGVSVFINSGGNVSYQSYTATDNKTLLDLSTRFRLTSTSSVLKDVTSRFRLSQQSLRYISTRFRLSQVSVRDISARFRIFQQSIRDVPTRFRLLQGSVRDVATRLRLSQQSVRDIATRLRLQSASQLKDVSSRFRINQGRVRDVTSRFRISQQSLKDVASRFRLAVANQSAKDVQARFRIQSANIRKDISARFRLSLFRDVQARFRLAQQSIRDTTARFRISQGSQKDVQSRLRLSQQVLKDLATRFRLSVSSQSIKDITARFILQVSGGASPAFKSATEIVSPQLTGKESSIPNLGYTRVLTTVLSYVKSVLQMTGASSQATPLRAAHTVSTMPTPFTTIQSTVTLLDVNNNPVTNASAVSLTVTYPDQTSSSYSLAGATITNAGSGKYQVTYNTKGPGPIREVWSFTAADTVTIASFQFVLETTY